jgi:hypothetical protein
MAGGGKWLPALAAQYKKRWDIAWRSTSAPVSLPGVAHPGQFFSGGTRRASLTLTGVTFLLMKLSFKYIFVIFMASHGDFPRDFPRHSSCFRDTITAAPEENPAKEDSP